MTAEGELVCPLEQPVATSHVLPVCPVQATLPLPSDVPTEVCPAFHVTVTWVELRHVYVAGKRSDSVSVSASLVSMPPRARRLREELTLEP